MSELRKRGRSSKYTIAKADEICARLSDGEPLRQICRDEDMPAWRTVYLWIEARAEFAARIAHARVLGQDAIFEDALNIADTPMIGTREEVSESGKKITTEDMLGHRKLQIETRLKLLAKWNPKKYGEKTAIEHSGSIGLESLVAGDE